MSIQALQWALEQKAGHPEAKLVLILLAAASGGPEAVCFPDMERLAEQAEMRRTDLRFVLASLRQYGLIVEIVPDFEFLVLPSDDASRALGADPERARREYGDYLAATRSLRGKK